MIYNINKFLLLQMYFTILWVWRNICMILPKSAIFWKLSGTLVSAICKMDTPADLLILKEMLKEYYLYMFSFKPKPEGADNCTVCKLLYILFNEHIWFIIFLRWKHFEDSVQVYRLNNPVQSGYQTVTIW